MARPKLTCPIAGCELERRPSQVMCKRHWFRVDGNLRTRIWHLFTTQRGSRQHLKANREAIDQVQALERSEQLGEPIHA